MRAGEASVIKPRFSLVVTNLADGGAQRVMLAFGREFALAGMMDQFYLLDPGGIAFKDEAAHVRPRGVLGPLGSRWLYPLCLPVLWFRLLLSRPDAVLSTLVLCNIITIIATRLIPFGRPVVIIREATTLGARYSGRGLLSRLLVRAAVLTYPLADIVIAPSEGVGDDLVRHVRVPVQKIHVLNNPAIPADFEKLCKEPVAHAFFKEGRSPLFAAMGHLGPVKGFDTLLDAFAIVERERPDARLLILGEGADRALLERQIEQLGLSGKVDLAGFRQNPFPYLIKANVFVLSSRWEGSPNALIQAMACGCTPVSTDCRSGPREILNDGSLGYLVPVDDPEALAEAMIFAADHPVPRERILERARDFGHHKAFKALIEIYRAHAEEVAHG
jgi:glycosyltransferase involved in cell wall biosynthesis